MSRGEKTDDPVAEDPRWAVDISEDGSAVIDGEPVPVVPGEPVDVAILDTLHGYARGRDASVTAAISDPAAGYVVIVEVAPDGSSTVLERTQAQSNEAGETGEADEVPEVTGFTPAPAPGPGPEPGRESRHPKLPPLPKLPKLPKLQPQSDDEYQGPGLLQRPAVIGGVALGVVALVMGSLVAVGSGGEQNRAAGSSNEAKEVPGTGEAQMYPPPTRGPDPFITPSPTGSSPSPDLGLSAPRTDDPGADTPDAGPGDDGDSVSDHTAASSRRGVALNPVPGTAKALVDSGVSWFHNWTSSTGELGKPGDAEYVPMIWGPGSVTKAELGSATKESSGNLLTFHEPDSSTQSDIGPERALELWPRLEKTGLRLGSPAVAGGAGKEGGWLDRFMRGAAKRDLRVDFISVHWYGSDFGPGATKKLRSYLQAVHKRYNKPVWLTEYALIDFSGDGPRHPSAKQQAAFIESSTDMLEGLDFVERYAWSALSTDTNPTGLYDGSTPNAGGRAYREAD